MECLPNNDPQLLRNFDNNEVITRNQEGLFLRYPHEKKWEFIQGYAYNVCEAEAKKLVEMLNIVSSPQLEYHHVDVTELNQERVSNDCGGILGNECHWDWHGNAKYNVYVTCKQ